MAALPQPEVAAVRSLTLPGAGAAQPSPPGGGPAPAPVAPPGDVVVERVAAVLGAFADDCCELGLSELSRRTGLAKPTVHRLAAQMVQAGLLERAGVRYRLGLRIFELGQRVAPHRALRDAALPFMEDLYVATRETVHLAMLQGADVLYLEKVTGHRAVTEPSRVAGHMPAHCTATGRAILAYARPDELAEVLRSGLARRTPYTVDTADRLIAALAQVRRSGVAVEREETRLGHASVAAPIFSGRAVVGALSVTAPTTRTDVDRLGPSVQTAAAGVSRVLQGRRGGEGLARSAVTD